MRTPSSSGLILAIGWIGVVLVLMAYAGATIGWWNTHSTVYLVGNLVGAIAILCEASVRKDYPPMALNIIWGLIAVLGLFGYFR